MKRISTLLVVAFVAVALAIPATAGAEDRAVAPGAVSLECDGITYDPTNPNHILVPAPGGTQGFVQAGAVALVVMSGPGQVVFVDYTQWGPTGPYPLWTGAVQVIGTVFADTICAGANDPFAAGVTGIDVIRARGGNDRIFGETGLDWIWGNGGDDYIEAGEIADFNLLPDFNGDTLANDDAGDRLIGGNGNDTIMGSPFIDVIVGGGGGDVVWGGLGADNIRGNGGDDLLYGWDPASDNPLVFGEDGTNRIAGGTGNDTIFAGDLGDLVLGGAGLDTITGGAGVDALRGGGNDDTINGGGGGDTIAGQNGDDLLNGDAGADIIVGNAGNDELHAGAEDATTPTPDVDNLNGGPGNDILVANGDSVAGGAGSAFAGDLLFGMDGDDNLFGAEGDDIITLGVGADEAFGFSGNDTFWDQSDLFVDNMFGEAGNDTYHGQEADADPTVTPGAIDALLGSCDPLFPSTATEVIGEGADDFNNMLFFAVYETGVDTVPAVAASLWPEGDDDVCGT